MASTDNIVQLLTSILTNVNEDFENFEPLKVLTAYKIKPYMVVLPLILITVFGSALVPCIAH